MTAVAEEYAGAAASNNTTVIPHGHQPGCGCGPCKNARAGAARRAQAAELRADMRATARLQLAIASKITGQPAPDAARSLVGASDAIRALRQAGMSDADLERVSERWSSERPVEVQHSQARPGSGFEGDPAHDPRVTDAIMAGRPLSEVNALITSIRKEMQAALDDRARKARQHESVLWETRNGPLQQDSESKAPVQTSVMYSDPRRV